MNRIAIALLTLALSVSWAGSQAQFTDDFSDGNFTAAPAWTGNDALFTVVDDGGDQVLRSNSPGASNYALSTASTLATNARWQWSMDLRFATSGANYVDVYLIADNADIPSVQNGWFVRVGGTQDRVELFKRVSGTNTSVLASADAVVNSSTSNPLVIRVERTAGNDWTLQFDDGNTGTFVVAGSANDPAVGAGTHFGLLVVQSSAASAVNNHFFDDFSVGVIPVDLSAPAVVSATAISATAVDVVYNEPLDPAFIGTYDIIPFIGVSGAVLDVSDPTLVHLTAALAFTNGNTYSLIAEGAQDAAGNAAAQVSIDFIYAVPETAGPRDVVINEIMADPSPVVGLPEVEFVELYNATPDRTFELSGWTFSDGGTPVSLPTYALTPGGHVLLTATANLALFPNITNKIGLASLPALNNDGDALELRDDNGQLIDAVTYALAWYQDAVKDDGGWTLEQIDPTAPCSGAANWRASNAAAGGTPGVQNSIYAIVPDLQAPTLGSVVVNSTTSITMVFSETMDAASLLAGSYVITPAVTVSGVTVPAADRAQLTLDEALVIGTLYTVTVSGVNDCPGNAIGAPNALSFALPEAVEVGDVVINEVLYDPIGSGSDLVELYNRSQKTLSLSGWKLANETDGVISSPTLINSAMLLLPGEYVLITESALNTASTYPQSRTERFVETDMPSYNNGEGTVVLQAPDGTTLDLFRYSDDLHFGLVNNTEGYTLERVVPDRPTEDATNWQTASDVAGKATPGFLNSQYAAAPEASGEMTIEPSIFSPDNDGYQDLLTIAYRFEQPGFVGTMSVFDIAGREMITLMENQLLGTEGAVSWDGLMDGGSKARMGAYVVLLEVYDLSGNVEKYKKTVTLAHRLDQ